MVGFWSNRGETKLINRDFTIRNLKFIRWILIIINKLI